MATHGDRLREEFRDCAPYCIAPPERGTAPDAKEVIKKEMRVQIRSAIIELLRKNYDLDQEIENQKILMGFKDVRTSPLEPAKHVFLFIINKEASLSQPEHIKLERVVEKFFSDLEQCIEAVDEIEGTYNFIELAPTEGLELAKILYTGEETLWKALDQIALALQNTEAMLHIRSIYHLQQRLDAGGPRSRLC